MEKVEKENLISADFFPKGIKINEKKIFPMAVIATMSSGKSTLINALLGKEILPNSNFACTSLNYTILDDDHETKEIICVTTDDGMTKVYDDNLSEKLAEINQDEHVTDVFIRSHVKGVMNTDKALLVIDTPGPNNSRNDTHENILFKTINKINGGLFLYVLNASQLGICDDRKLLSILKHIMDNNSNIHILFAVNKIDVLDNEYESIEGVMETVKNYLKESGFEKANIIPVSARAALLFKKVLAGDKLTRREYREFEYLYDLYKPVDFNMRKYAITNEVFNQNDEIEVNGIMYKIGNLNQAIENTGIKMLEDFIQKAQILSGERIKNTVKVKSN